MPSKKAQLILAAWRKKCPPDASLSDVMTVVDEYLHDQKVTITGSGSHVFYITHPVFKKMNLFDGHGQFSISAHNNKVTKCYIKDILKAIEVMDIIKSGGR